MLKSVLIAVSSAVVVVATGYVSLIALIVATSMQNLTIRFFIAFSYHILTSFSPCKILSMVFEQTKKLLQLFFHLTPSFVLVSHNQNPKLFCPNGVQGSFNSNARTSSLRCCCCSIHCLKLWYVILRIWHIHQLIKREIENGKSNYTKCANKQKEPS